MKTVLFLDRDDLTDLYLLIGKALEGKANVIHVAYSEKEAQKLEHAGISDYCHYRRMFSDFVDYTKLDMKIIEELDREIITYSNGDFNLNASIQSDRGYSILTYEECLLSAQSHYLCWKKIFSEYKVDLLYHELCSLNFNHIAALLCRKQGGEYRYMTQRNSDLPGYSYMYVIGDKMTAPQIECGYAYYISHPQEIQIERCKTFLNKFRKDYSIFLGNVKSPNTSTFSLLKKSAKMHLVYYIRRKNFDRIKDNISYWLLQQDGYKEKIVNRCEYKKRKIEFVTTPNPKEKYYYYSMHLEPEAVVLYPGGGLYTNQIKLIENIAASLPAGTYLYVKDHPHEFAYRRADDYDRLMKVPNVRLIHRSIPGKTLIANAIGVFTINGTAGFEGLLLGKQVYCFGKNFYSFMDKVNYIHNIKDARDIIYSNIGRQYEDDIELYAYLNAYLDACHPGFVAYFGGMQNTCIRTPEDNAKMIAGDIIKELYE